jgi:hypothetical protein
MVFIFLFKNIYFHSNNANSSKKLANSSRFMI